MTVSGLATPFGFQTFPNYTQGRQGSTVKKIVIHHMATTAYDSVPGIWNSRQASAHYGIGQNGEIRSYVDENNTAWHAGDWTTNISSIGIEHANSTLGPDWGINQATVDASARLVADIAKRYGLGKVVPYQNLFPHKHFIATGCPGKLTDKLQEIADKANAINNGGTVTTPTSTQSSAPKSAIDKFKEGKDRFVLNGEMTVNDVQKDDNGVWRVRVNELTAEPFDWGDNGIPTVLLNRVGTSVRDFNPGDKVVFKSDYSTGTIDKYYSAGGLDAVGIYYVQGKFLVWYDANKFWAHP